MSLTGTGLARIDSHGGELTVQTSTVGSGSTGSSIPGRSDRLRRLASQIIAACDGADLVVVESPAYSSNSGHAHDRSGLWWLVLARLTAHDVPVVEVRPNTLKVYATGGGRASKDMVLAQTVRRYGHLVPDLSSNDEADGLVIASMGWHRLTGRPVVKLPETHTRALAAPEWPANIGGK